MHELEPFYRWRDYYSAEEDKKSPFYGRTYSEFEYTHTIYNYYIHPQWDDIGSPTLFIKILYADYHNGFAIIEMIGEWNDCIHNDIMFLKREIIEKLLSEGIYRYILIGENVLNFHGSDDCYYEEWYEDVADEGGWLVGLGFREHVAEEMKKHRIPHYLLIGPRFDEVNWRTYEPLALYEIIEHLLLKALPQ